MIANLVDGKITRFKTYQKRINNFKQTKKSKAFNLQKNYSFFSPFTNFSFDQANKLIHNQTEESAFKKTFH